MEPISTPPVCDYEGSDYQRSFWDQGDRDYEDRTEAIALKRLLPVNGRLLLELGAGAGRNTSRYAGFDRVVLLDYSKTQLQEAQARLEKSHRYVFVTADIYRLPFVDGLFDCATMIRTLHHMADAPQALAQISKALHPGSVLILEFASKLHLKSIFRYLFRKQAWNPFVLEPVEFVELNFNFHPKAVRKWLQNAGFGIEQTLTLSHFRSEFLKKFVPTGFLVGLDALAQWTGSLWQLTPSVFYKASLEGASAKPFPKDVNLWFKCPHCGLSPLENKTDHYHCQTCGSDWAFTDGIFDFKEPLSG